jgi:hypothetical protein
MKTLILILICSLPVLAVGGFQNQDPIHNVRMISDYSMQFHAKLYRGNESSAGYQNRLYHFDIMSRKQRSDVTMKVVFEDFSELEGLLLHPITLDKLGGISAGGEWTQGLPSRKKVDFATLHHSTEFKRGNSCTVILGDELCGIVLSCVIVDPGNSRASAEALALHYRSEIHRLFKVVGSGSSRTVIPR